MHKLQPLWDMLEVLLRQSLEDVRSALPQEHAEIVEGFIDHNEFGLAHDFLLGFLGESSIRMGEASSERMREAARLMKRPLD